MALYEAIRQGQAKIAQGLESGQMRSDVTSAPQKGVGAASGKNALLKKIDSLSGISALSKILAVAIGVAVLVLVLFVIWLAIRPDSQPIQTDADTPGGSVSPQQTPVVEPTEAQKEQSSGFFGFGGKKAEVDQPAPKPEPAQPSAEPGENVIVIQQIHPQQQDKLLPVQKYYDDNGIPTEMLQRSGYTLLVTRAGFDHNPNREGSEGYRLMQRIRQLGSIYPEKTGDTKFGLRPFQDAYALKK